MSQDSPDSNDQPITATEEFRRSWRNSLLWSLLAIAVGLGSTANDVQVSLLGTGLAFNQRVLAFAALLIAGFMFLVYLRALANDRRRNTQSAIEANSAELTDIIAHTVSDAEDAKAAMIAARAGADTLTNDLRQAMLHHKYSLEDPRNADTAIAELQRLAMPYRPPLSMLANGDANSVRYEIYTSITQRIDALTLHYSQKIERGNAKVEEILVSAEEMKSSAIDGMLGKIDIFDTATQRLHDSADRLTRFYSRISRRDRRWSALLDIAAVWTMFGLAVLSAGTRTFGCAPDRILGTAVTQAAHFLRSIHNLLHLPNC